MALFKIKRGLAADLPTSYVEGYCYVTTDDGKFYIDTSNSAAGRIVLNAAKADKATVLATARSLQTNLASATAASFDGSGNASIGVTGTLAVGNGGTGKTSWTKYGLVYASASATLASLGVGNSGQVLSSKGTTSAPQWINQSSLAAGTAGKFASAQTIALTGDITGSASSQAGWSIATTLADSGVTAGSYGPSKNVSPAHGGTFSVPYVTFDAKGRATAASTKTITLPTYTIGNATITIKAGTGLKTGGSFTTNQTSDGTITLNHSNSITAGSVGTAQSPSHGGTFAIPKITYDAQGHITAATTVNITLPADNNTLNTAGSSNTSSKIFLVGATSQASSATTYSHDTAYVGTDGHLYSNSQKVLNATNYSDYAVPLIEGSTSGSYTVYRALGNLYKGGEAVTYYRIALPQATSWGMIMMKLVIRENYSGGSTGEIIIYANHSSTAEWNTFYASCIGNLSTNIKVYGSDKKYLYIKGDFSYAGLSVELMTVGDSAANINLSNITIDTVTALPKTYQTATMLYSLHSGNYTSYTVTKTGSGASGTWGISISGTAAAAPWSGITGKPSYYDPKAIKSITRSGTTFTATHLDGTTSTFTQQDNNNTYTLAGLGGIGSISFAGTALTVSGTSASITQANARKALGLGSNAYTSTAYLPLTGGTLTGNLSGTNATFSGTVTGNKVYGAVWNDYAEYRWVLKDKATDKMPEPGRCVVENGNDSMSISNGRLQPGAKIISDTYGMCMGETEKAKTPIAVCGRVLAHPFERKIAFNVGDAVCSGPNGTVSRMTREEIMMYPERIVGTVVSKPTYKEWGPNKIPVNGRIWIQVK